jgi:ATP:ADP antiporter, AAA family
MIKTLRLVKREVGSYSIFEKLFILCVMLCGFCITSEYSITKPVSYSVFISCFSTSFFPYAWLCGMPINLLVVYLYNKLLPKLGCFKMVVLTTSLVVLINILSTKLLIFYPKLSFFHFIWKDIYVLLMFQHLWSVIHSTIDIKKAKYLYGIIYGFGGLGSVLGSFVPGFLATRIGSENLLFSTCIFYFVFTVSYKLALKMRDKISESGKEIQDIALDKKDTKGGFKLILQSRYLRFILLIVVFMQLSAALVDFQFNTYLEALIPQKDLRTEYYGKLFGLIHSVNVFFQVCGSFAILHFIGLRRSHILIPILFGLNIVTFIFFPVFRIISICFATIKSFDYSVFGILKEMLYIPLGVNEKFKAKAVIDVFAYRSSKALSSFIILGLQLIFSTSITAIISWALLAVFILWMSMSIMLFKKQDLAAKALN